MTAMQDDLGQRGDVAAAALIAEVHTPRRCRDCAAGSCEHGTWAAETLAAHRASLPKPPQQMSGHNQRPTEYRGATR